MEHYTRLAALVSLALPVAAHAQTASHDPAVLPQIEISAKQLGESTEGTGSYTTGKARTATPLSMSLRDTPQSSSVLTQQRIADQGLASVSDVVNNATGVSVNQYETHRAGFTARGFDIDSLQIDGISTTWDQPWSAGEVLGSLAIYDRVEIVRGATGLMTGAGNPSAAINLVRKRASSKVLTGSAELGLGSWDGRRLMADVSTPLTADGSVRARVVGEAERGNSWVSLMKRNNETLYATLEADLSSKTLLAIGFSRQQTDPEAPMWGGLPYWYTDGSKTDWDRAKTSAADWARWSTGYDNTFADVEHGLDNGWKLRATFSHGKKTSDSALLYLSGVPDRVSGLGMNAFAGSYLTAVQQNDVGLHASGPFTLLGRKHEAAFGYMQSKQTFGSDSRAADFGGDVPAVGNFNQWDGAAYPAPAWGPATFYEHSETRQQALYGMARLALSDPLRLILGARVSNYEKTGHGLWTAAYTLKHEREVTPYAGLVLDLSDNYSAYVSHTSIFQPQNLKDLAGANLDPILGRSTELGVKGELFDGRLNASGALFRIKQDNLGQAAGMIDRDANGPLAPEAYYRAADGAVSEGYEFELGGELARGWNASAGYTRYKAKDAAGADVNSVYPRKLLRVFTTYQLAGALQGLTVGGGVNYEGRTYTVDPLAPAGTNGLIEQDAFSLVNLMARYEFGQNWSAQLNVSNALDKKHFGMFAAYGAITYAAPRTTSLTLKYRF
jgi:outer membrane receptor for ferric coprogen and ferric-rhodotorulic acid